ncbi:acetate--CoA ligase family protein [Nonomuraea sp. NPDC049625]|uniref:acetate--CoA ligase family protein n=1 Tax=Nonomuraea sp. NPDC049625 TaxID=3155775 RepID=UPI00341E91E4
MPPSSGASSSLESFGNPRKFARCARRVGRRKPVLLVKSGRGEAGGRAVRSHTAAAASPDVAVDALTRAAGVIRLDSVHELIDTAKLLAGQPLPAGRRVAVVGNSGGPQAMAADACEAHGLIVPELPPGLLEARAGLRRRPRRSDRRPRPQLRLPRAGPAARLLRRDAGGVRRGGGLPRGLPAVLKATGPVHKSEVGEVRLNLQTPDEARQAYHDMSARIGTEMTGAIIQRCGGRADQRPSRSGPPPLKLRPFARCDGSDTTRRKA